uniref:ATP synthase F0 subunit 8 n=1 Tax=Trimeresurus stejnegeri stejnegeri TaxID=604432 RepID=C0LQE2_TRIST|nr:ATP synthase F0 subunit 8 [Trimeresurus stejnegeri stejnegeri]ACN37850.1 ATP synthase F0 subunit 8 [Trimeresurus stejnegeri stejnegeri]
MPQLDIVYTLMVYLWTWLTLTLITLKIKTFTLITKPAKQPLFKTEPTTLPLPWT